MANRFRLAPCAASKLSLIHIFPRPLNIFVNVALIFTVLMHGMQLALLKSTLPKDGPQMTLSLIHILNVPQSYGPG